MIAAHRVIKAKDVRPRTEPPRRIAETGHRPGQQWLHDVGMKLPGQLRTGQDWISHETSRPHRAWPGRAIFSRRLSTVPGVSAGSDGASAVATGLASPIDIR